ncbi:MAG TPA: PIG-L family deacetylase [Mycobacteriales bacterium]|nr:PIG-L family deacetylase [Mycobacteriales bacterium]
MTLLLDTPLFPAESLSGRTVVVLHAHPDDEAIFTGATVRRLADRGARVVLVTATAGEMGTPRFPVDDVAAVRRAELEAAAEELGVARLVLLGRRDSGMAGWESGSHPQALLRADLRALGTTVARLAARESAEAVITYDADGIYGHPDHVAVHLVGRHAAELAGLTLYESTVDREHLHFAGAHVLDAAASAPGRYGRVTAEITTALAATPAELAAKRRAMAAHASQIDPAELDDPGFADAYELEWFVRRGAPALLEQLGNAHALA